MRFPLLLAAAAAIATTGGCGLADDAGKAASAPSAAFALSESELPSGVYGGCACVTRRMCPVLEQVPGWSEVRAVSCRWIEQGVRARCRYETRFTRELPPYDGNRAAAVPGPWTQEELVARHLPSGRWCAEDATP